MLIMTYRVLPIHALTDKLVFLCFLFVVCSGPCVKCSSPSPAFSFSVTLFSFSSLVFPLPVSASLSEANLL